MLASQYKVTHLWCFISDAELSAALDTDEHTPRREELPGPAVRVYLVSVFQSGSGTAKHSFLTWGWGAGQIYRALCNSEMSSVFLECFWNKWPSGEMAIWTGVTAAQVTYQGINHNINLLEQPQMWTEMILTWSFWPTQHLKGQTKRQNGNTTNLKGNKDWDMETNSVSTPDESIFALADRQCHLPCPAFPQYKQSSWFCQCARSWGVSWEASSCMGSGVD